MRTRLLLPNASQLLGPKHESMYLGNSIQHAELHIKVLVQRDRQAGRQQAHLNKLLHLPDLSGGRSALGLLQQHQPGNLQLPKIDVWYFLDRLAGLSQKWLLFVVLTLRSVTEGACCLNYMHSLRLVVLPTH